MKGKRRVQFTGAAEYADYKGKDENPRYDTKQFDDEAPVILELWWIRSTTSLPLLPVPL